MQLTKIKPDHLYAVTHGESSTMSRTYRNNLVIARTGSAVEITTRRYGRTVEKVAEFFPFDGYDLPDDRDYPLDAHEPRNRVIGPMRGAGLRKGGQVLRGLGPVAEWPRIRAELIATADERSRLDAELDRQRFEMEQAQRQFIDRLAAVLGPSNYSTHYGTKVTDAGLRRLLDIIEAADMMVARINAGGAPGESFGAVVGDAVEAWEAVRNGTGS